MDGNDIDSIEAGVQIPDEIATRAVLLKLNQDAARGDWSSPRGVEQPYPPFPNQDSPMLCYLMAKATACIVAGMDPSAAMLSLAVHAWFEGGVENYDRGRRDGERASS